MHMFFHADTREISQNFIGYIYLYIRQVKHTADHTYQTNEDADELYNISVSHGVEPSNQRVENSDTRRDNDRRSFIQADHDADGSSKSS